MEIRYHRHVQADLNEALRYYGDISESLYDDFYKEFCNSIERVLDQPKLVER